ncbi:TRAP transporter small permease [Actinobacteria bacterium YIM 96077]|uniref:TRAP transporter small permease n=1 Tax=Phytoactinopolyspora halophila TaxID=1981511 RepID=A0A329QFY0_9ACTN|nr:TRAP transporter small permease [Phytoactinopolyspora halophila]AYY12685.1 TRAP transporter small permease [Actinobacteria bacterium YIM 96077]RAW10599.1 TRAP transporter small permease [Phytoactinopolyspora halophila]
MTPSGEDDAPDAPDYLERVSRPYRAAMQLERAVCCLLLVATFSVIFLQVVTRYVFSSPLPWTEEVARFLLVWLTFAAAGYVTARRLHISVDLLMAGLGRRLAVAVDTFAMLVVVLVAGSMTVAAFGAAGEATTHAPATGLPVSVIYLAGFIGFGLMLAHSLFNIYVNVRHPREVPKAMDSVEKEGI